MSMEFNVRRLDVKALAQASETLSGQLALADCERLLAETDPKARERTVQWEARGEMQRDVSGVAQIWLYLHARASLPLTCQRCLGPADIDVVVDRAFRFVATEEQAEAEDEEAEEDVLALQRDFDLHELIEDELLMALPLVPKHETCPAPVQLSAEDPGFEAASADRPKPFAALAGLRAGGKKPGESGS